MTTETETLPTREQVAGVYVILDVESIRRPATRRQDRRAAHEVMHTFLDAAFPEQKGHHDDPFMDKDNRGGWCDVDDCYVDSDYDSSMLVYAGKVAIDLTLEQWLRVADAFCMDLTDDQVLPDNIEPTMGSLTGEHGWIPAVRIPYLDEGWDDFSHQPALIVSMYVSILLHDEGTN